MSGSKGRTPGTFRGRFQSSRWIGVRTRPGGFEINGELQDELRGRIAKTVSVRKRFEDGVLACRSPNGERSEDGVLCAECLHPDCRPILRIQLRGPGDTWVLDLPHSSARNLINLEDELSRTDHELVTTDLTLTVEDRGHWGEVRFRID